MERHIWTLSPAGMGLGVLAAEVGGIVNQVNFTTGGKREEKRRRKVREENYNFVTDVSVLLDFPHH